MRLTHQSVSYDGAEHLRFDDILLRLPGFRTQQPLGTRRSVGMVSTAAGQSGYYVAAGRGRR